MFQPGDKVFVENSAQIDVGYLAWFYVDKHRDAEVRQRMTYIEHDDKISEAEHVYAIEFAEEFPGGHDCQKNCAPHRGQFVAAKHLSLKFEESREVTTVPNIKVSYDDEFDLEDPEL
jgi:hypothetical protein